MSAVAPAMTLRIPLVGQSSPAVCVSGARVVSVRVSKHDAPRLPFIVVCAGLTVASWLTVKPPKVTPNEAGSAAAATLPPVDPESVAGPLNVSEYVTGTQSASTTATWACWARTNSTG